MSQDAIGALARDMLVALCRRDAGATAATTTVSAVADRTLRLRLLEVAERHGVQGLVLARLESSGNLILLEESAKEPLRRVLRRRRMRAALLRLERDHLLTILAEAGVRAVVLKGAGLASTVFPDPVERDFADIDVLVAPAQLDAAVRALESQGYGNAYSTAAQEAYRAHHFHIALRRRGATIVELHWGLVQRAECFQLNAADFIERSVARTIVGSTATGDGVALRIPCPEHALLHIIVECARGAFSRIRWLVDIDRIIATTPAMDWGYVVASARAGNLRTSLSLALELSHRALGTPVPEVVRRQLRPSAMTRAHLALLCPLDLMMQQRALERVSSADLLQLWLLAGASRARWLRMLMRSSQDDPLEWVWDEVLDRSSATRSLWQRAARVGKLIVHQGGVYAAGARGMLMRRGRERMRIW